MRTRPDESVVDEPDLLPPDELEELEPGFDVPELEPEDFEGDDVEPPPPPPPDGDDGDDEDDGDGDDGDEEDDGDGEGDGEDDGGGAGAVISTLANVFVKLQVTVP